MLNPAQEFPQPTTHSERESYAANPYPGSLKAAGLGCKCPKLDNRDPLLRPVRRSDCPLHGVEAEPEMWK